MYSWADGDRLLVFQYARLTDAGCDTGFCQTRTCTHGPKIFGLCVRGLMLMWPTMKLRLTPLLYAISACFQCGLPKDKLNPHFLENAIANSSMCSYVGSCKLRDLGSFRKWQ